MKIVNWANISGASNDQWHYSSVERLANWTLHDIHLTTAAKMS